MLVAPSETSKIPSAGIKEMAFKAQSAIIDIYDTGDKEKK